MWNDSEGICSPEKGAAETSRKKVDNGTCPSPPIGREGIYGLTPAKPGRGDGTIGLVPAN